MQQCESAICVPSSPPTWACPPPMPPLQVVTEHQAELPVLCSSFPLAVCFTQGSVYMSVIPSQFVPPSPSPAVSRSLEENILYTFYIGTAIWRDRQTDWPTHSVCCPEAEDLNQTENQASCLSETSFIRDPEKGGAGWRRALSALAGWTGVCVAELGLRVPARASSWEGGGSPVSEAHRTFVFWVISIWLCVLFPKRRPFAGNIFYVNWVSCVHPHKYLPRLSIMRFLLAIASGMTISLHLETRVQLWIYFGHLETQLRHVVLLFQDVV